MNEMDTERDSKPGLAEVGENERYYMADGTPVSRRLVRILADMVDAAMKATKFRRTQRARDDEDSRIH
jgi:hypothetical protein